MMRRETSRFLKIIMCCKTDVPAATFFPEGTIKKKAMTGKNVEEVRNKKRQKLTLAL